MARSDDWIRQAIGKTGALRVTLNARPGEPIPRKKLEQASKRPGVTGQRARFALTLRSLNKDA